MLPASAIAGVGRGENAKQSEACEQARTKAEATCTDGRVKDLGKCDCVERATTLYLKNWRCAVEATCETDAAKSSDEKNRVASVERRRQRCSQAAVGTASS
jgi:hypothetical protein